MNDSGAEFVTSALSVDSDTDAAMTYASHRPLLNAISPTAETGEAHYDIEEAGRTSDSFLSASTTSNHQSVTAVNLNAGTASPGTTSRGSIGSDLGKTEGSAEQKGEAAQSTWNSSNLLEYIFIIWLCFQEPKRNHQLKTSSPLDPDHTVAQDLDFSIA